MVPRMLSWIMASPGVAGGRADTTPARPRAHLHRRDAPGRPVERRSRARSRECPGSDTPCIGRNVRRRERLTPERGFRPGLMAHVAFASTRYTRPVSL